MGPTMEMGMTMETGTTTEMGMTTAKAKAMGMEMGTGMETEKGTGKLAAELLVRRGSLDVIDDKKIDRTSTRFELQP